MATALATLMAMPAVPLAPYRSPVIRLARLEAALGPGSPTILAKRDDLLGFGLGGNKVRKIQLIAAEVAKTGADTVITCGTVQSNHARVTAATGAALGWKVILVLSGEPPAVPSGNFAHDLLFGAEVRFVADRSERNAAMEMAAAEVRTAGGRPFVIPMGASTPVGAMGMARAISELSADGVRPDVVIHASSSGGTQAGLVAGCALFGLAARVVGISVDDPAETIAERVRGLIAGMAGTLGGRPDTLAGRWPVDVDESQIGEGYAVPTAASTEARVQIARTEGFVLDNTYTAKAMAGLIARVRGGELGRGQTVLFWHTGGMSE